MYSLESIVAQNRRAVEQGVIKAGSAVGTAGFVPFNERKGYRPGDRHPSWEVGGEEVKGHSASQGGLRGHSIGEDYPWSVSAGFDGGVTTWTVVNHLTGETGGTHRGLPENPAGCGAAHDEAHQRKLGTFTTTTE